jgi:hypothetical protein
MHRRHPAWHERPIAPPMRGYRCKMQVKHRRTKPHGHQYPSSGRASGARPWPESTWSRSANPSKILSRDLAIGRLLAKETPTQHHGSTRLRDGTQKHVEPCESRNRARTNTQCDCMFNKLCSVSKDNTCGHDGRIRDTCLRELTY